MATVSESLKTIWENRRIAREVMGEILKGCPDPDIERLHKKSGHSTAGFAIQLLKDHKVVLEAELAMIEAARTMQFGGLHILLLTLWENNIRIDWDEAYMLNNFFRKDDIARDIPTSKVVEYAQKGLQQSLREIRTLPPEDMMKELYHVIIGTTAWADIPSLRGRIKPKPILPRLEAGPS